ncbi:Smr/MutS family protein [Desulfoplanes formicivorans]|uniref:Smr protein/MutS2 n=1 Tax=Desulfoplanes formicivorans TaxID=1592317 RepID=A0A194AHH9_9BACT|nr:Smr/MutS family protein [Desulfoplanes formicivorans]GAU09542.1 Smr protein/MutS2 [Desulfoplanes formicivorans]
MHSPFKKMKITLASSRKEPPSSDQDVPSEEELFNRAMQDVAPLRGQGRDIAPLPSAEKKQVAAPRTTPSFGELVHQTIEFDLESTHDFIQGYVRGMDPKTFRKLKAGSFSVEAHLDLHGQTLDQAQVSFLDFMRETYLKGMRCVLVIPGRGKNSPLGMGILRQGVQTWLTRDPVKRIVLAFCTAQPRHGGAGALYVLLRKRKKGQGKIFWNKMHFDKL